MSPSYPNIGVLQECKRLNSHRKPIPDCRSLTENATPSNDCRFRRDRCRMVSLCRIWLYGNNHCQYILSSITFCCGVTTDLCDLRGCICSASCRRCILRDARRSEWTQVGPDIDRTANVGIHCSDRSPTQLRTHRYLGGCALNCRSLLARLICRRRIRWC